MLPEEKARATIDKQLNGAGWDVVSRGEYVPGSASAVKEALMQGNTESDYLLFIDAKNKLKISKNTISESQKEVRTNDQHNQTK